MDGDDRPEEGQARIGQVRLSPGKKTIVRLIIREFEIVECVALVYGTMYENQIIRRYFDADKMPDSSAPKLRG